MAAYIRRRLLQSVIVVWGVTLIVFFLLRLAPGDPVLMLLAESAGPEQIAAARAKWGLDQPIQVQFVEFVQGVLSADLGKSIEHGLPVTTLLASRLPPTLLLGGAAILLNFTLALWLGVRHAVRRGSREDRTLTVLSLAGYATPSFWLGLVLAWLVGIRFTNLVAGAAA